MITSLKRIVRAGFVGFWRNAFVSLSAIFVITLTLLVVGGTILFNQILTTSITQIQNKVDINVYIQTVAEEQAILDLKSSLERLPDVREVIYLTREDTLALFRERHQDDERTIQALEELNENPLGATLSIRAKETSQYESIAAFLEEYRASEAPDKPLIDRINYNKNKEAIAKLSRIVDAVEQSSLVIMMVLVVSSILIAFNTIRLAIYTAREEISVMRLVGASNMFIRGPLIFQGVMYGLVAGVLSLLILYPIAVWLGPGTEQFFSLNIFEYFVNNFGFLFAVLVGSGIVLGMISSTLAIARYLRV
jgi:cell division transport system permease protein